MEDGKRTVQVDDIPGMGTWRKQCAHAPPAAAPRLAKIKPKGCELTEQAIVRTLRCVADSELLPPLEGDKVHRSPTPEARPPRAQDSCSLHAAGPAGVIKICSPPTDQENAEEGIPWRLP
jgi:hypothetical protein